ncbi:MAG: response regulator transcription factor [Bacteroidota bacterium]
MINVILADDHKIVVEGLKYILKEDSSIKVVGEAYNGHQVLKILAKNQKVDIVVLDVEMDKMDGIETAKQINKRYPKTKILMLSMHKEKELLVELVDIGIAGYVLKDNTASQLVSAIHQIMAGKPFFGLAVLDVLSQPKPKKEYKQTVLTSQEENVLSLIGDGKTAKEISLEMNIKETTVNTHKRNLRHKLDVPNEKHLIRYAIKYGYSKV